MSMQNNPVHCAAVFSLVFGSLGFAGMYGYTHLIEHVTDPDSLAFANFGNLMGAGFFAIVGLIVGAVLGTITARRNDKP